MKASAIVQTRAFINAFTLQKNYKTKNINLEMLNKQIFYENMD